MKRWVPFLALAFAALSCNTTDPPAEVPKDPRAYSWDVDTLSYPGSFQTMMNDIWASSSKDVYLVGYNSGGHGQMFDLDGTGWQAVDLNFGPIALRSIHGFSSDDCYCRL